MKRNELVMYDFATTEIDYFFIYFFYSFPQKNANNAARQLAEGLTELSALFDAVRTVGVTTVGATRGFIVDNLRSRSRAGF